MTAFRGQKLAEEIRERVAEIIACELKDPRIGFVTVTRVQLTSDLRLAHIYVGVLGEPAVRQETLKRLDQAKGFVRRALGRRIRLRHLPEILFVYDRGLDAADRVAQLIDEVHAEDESRGRDTSAGGDPEAGEPEPGDHED